jgi:hypothetical protein
MARGQKKIKLTDAERKAANDFRKARDDYTRLYSGSTPEENKTREERNDKAYAKLWSLGKTMERVEAMVDYAGVSSPSQRSSTSNDRTDQDETE